MSTESDTAKSPAAPEPKVQVTPDFAAGQTVKHQNGHTYKIVAVRAEGIQLEGVANHVHPSALRPAPAKS